MASLEDDAAATTLMNKYSDVLPLENDPFPQRVMKTKLPTLLNQRLCFGLRNWIVNMTSGSKVMMVKKWSDAWKP